MSQVYPSLWIKYPDRYPDVVTTFRKMKNEIMRYNNNNKILFFLTGTDRHVGVSSVAFNLALICGWDLPDARILLIDTNVSNPVLHKSFPIEYHLGLADFLYKKATMTEILYKTEMDNLDLIPIGAGFINMPSPFSRKIFVDFLEKIKNIYDIIFIDTEPVLYSEYTQSIISYADGVILIAESGKTRLDDIEKSCMQIKKCGVDYIGNFLNRKKKFYFGADKFIR